MKFPTLSKRGLARLLPAVQVFIVVGILIGIGIILLDDFKVAAEAIDTAGNNGTAYQALNTTMAAIGDFADWLPIMVIGIAAVILLGLVIGGLMRRRPV